jgi:hypothetical protein
MNLKRLKKNLHTGQGARGTSRRWGRLAPALALGVLVIAAVLAAPLCHALEDRSWRAGHQGAALDAPGAGSLLAGSQPLGRLGGDGDDDDDDEGDCNP